MDTLLNVSSQGFLVNSLVSNFKTGNTIIDTVIAVVFGSIVMWILSCKPDFNKLYDLLFKRFKHKTSKYKHHMYFDCITMEGVTSVNINSGNSILINSILAGLKATNCMDDCSDYHVINVLKTNRELSVRERNQDSKLFYIPKSKVTWNDMQFEFTYTVELQGDKGKNSNTTTFGIGISYNNLKLVEQTLTQWKNEEVERLYPTVKREDPLYFWFIESTTSKSPTSYNFTKRLWSSAKTFNTLFFDRKEEILNMMTQFKESTGPWHPSKERTNTFRMFLNGPPGTGKTSIIKAWANRDNLHIFRINMGLIETNEDLLSIMSDRTLVIDEESETVELNRRLYVLEDLDCDDCRHIIEPRTNFVQDCNTDKISLVSTKNDTSNTGKVIDLFKKSKVNLSGFLNTLDGIYELSGVRLVITTNDKSKFDSAIFRPGRMDVVLELNYMSPENIKKYLNHYYGTIPENHFEGVKLTPSKIEQICQSHSTAENAISEILCPNK